METVLESCLEVLDSSFYITPSGILSVPIVESKNINDLDLPIGRKAIINTFQKKSTQTETSNKAFQVLQGKYLSELKSVFDNVLDKRITKRDGENRIKSVIRDFFVQSYLLGRSSSGSSFLDNFKEDPSELKFARNAAKTESKYALNFLSQANRRGTYSSYRLNMYGRTLDSMFTNGWIASLPDGTKVNWVLHAKESCKDCIALAAKSPYIIGGKHKLPTVPRAGDSVCLSNCKCSLDVELPRENVSVKKEKELFFLKGGAIVDSTDSKIVEQANSLYDELNLVRLKMLMGESDETKLKILIRKRAELNQSIIDLQDATGVSIKPRYSVRDLQNSVDNFKGLEQISSENLKEKESVVLVKNVFSIPSVVKKVLKSGVNLISAYGQFRVSFNDFVMFFKNE